MKLSNAYIAVIGLGYVGLPLAIEFSKKYPVVGFDIDDERITQLLNGEDKTLEVTKKQLSLAKSISFSSRKNDLKEPNIYIITVPTPIDDNKQPDLTPLINASKMVGSYLKKNDLVIYESTVYPGATEEVCVPILEKESGFVYNKDFYAGYSPERINPGDKEHSVTNIVKVTSGSNITTAELVDSLYSSIITAGTFKASSIKVAEAAKVIENTQRDVNIALINELSIIFNRLGIDTLEVLEAAGTKWNFLPFRPGLVGGHCIGVDPYYLSYKAQSIGYYPEIILSGRRLNDGMGAYVATELIKSMIKKRIQLESAKILIMGLTFKENCPDTRNTKVIDIAKELNEYNINYEIYDPWCSNEIAKKDFNLNIIQDVKSNNYDAIIIAVRHDIFKEMGVDNIRKLGKKSHILYDLKHLFSIQDVDMRL